MKANRKPTVMARQEPLATSGMRAVRVSDEHVRKAVDWMLAHLDEEEDPVTRQQLATAILVGYFETIAARVAPDWRPARSKARALVEHMAAIVASRNE